VTLVITHLTLESTLHQVTLPGDVVHTLHQVPLPGDVVLRQVDANFHEVAIVDGINMAQVHLTVGRVLLTFASTLINIIQFLIVLEFIIILLPAGSQPWSIGRAMNGRL
jgi:hypothetical protein